MKDQRQLLESASFASCRMMRLDDDDRCGIVKVRTSHRSSLLSVVNEELNQLPENVFSIECMPVARTRKTADQEYLSKHSVLLRVKLLEKSHPMIPPLRLHITTSYPEQPPEVLSLTKSMPPRLEFTGDIAALRINTYFSSVGRRAFVFRSDFVDVRLAALQTASAAYPH